MRDTVVIRSYPKVWDIESRIYSVLDLRLPAPVETRAVLYYGVVLLTVVLLQRIFPFLSGLPWAIRYAIIPGVAAWALMKKKLDGKAPHRFLFSLLVYLLHKGQYVSGFQYYAKRRRERLRWFCRRGELKEGRRRHAAMSG